MQQMRTKGEDANMNYEISCMKEQYDLYGHGESLHISISRRYFNISEVNKISETSKKGFKFLHL